jgi:hypothetical protein
MLCGLWAHWAWLWKPRIEVKRRRLVANMHHPTHASHAIRVLCVSHAMHAMHVMPAFYAMRAQQTEISKFGVKTSTMILLYR